MWFLVFPVPVWKFPFCHRKDDVCISERVFKRRPSVCTLHSASVNKTCCLICQTTRLQHLCHLDLKKSNNVLHYQGVPAPGHHGLHLWSPAWVVWNIYSSFGTYRRVGLLLKQTWICNSIPSFLVNEAGQNCLCRRYRNGIHSKRDIKDIQFYPATIFCDRVEIV